MQPCCKVKPNENVYREGTRKGLSKQQTPFRRSMVPWHLWGPVQSQVPPKWKWVQGNGFAALFCVSPSPAEDAVLAKAFPQRQRLDPLPSWSQTHSLQNSANFLLPLTHPVCSTNPQYRWTKAMLSHPAKLLCVSKYYFHWNLLLLLMWLFLLLCFIDIH